MKVRWEMSIGYPGAEREGEAWIDDAELKGLTDEQRKALIDKEIWEDAMQYVDVYPVEKER